MEETKYTIKNGMKLTLVSIFILVLVSLVAATMNDTKVEVCNDVHLNFTEPYCTTWWNTLNLTETNFTIINQTNITYTNVTYINNLTISYVDNRNQTMNNTIVNTNHSTIENKTYVTYNYTGNISDINFTYSNEKIKNFIPGSAIDTKISSALGSYALKTDITFQNVTSIEELGDSVVVWRWIFIALISLIILIGLWMLLMKNDF